MAEKNRPLVERLEEGMSRVVDTTNKVVESRPIKKVSGFIRNFEHHPLAFTTVMGPATLISLLDKSESDPIKIGSALAYGLGLGLVIDGARYLFGIRRINEIKNSTSEIAKVLDNDYLKGIIDDVREHYGFEGECISIKESTGRQDGTNIFQRGYFTEIDLNFKEGNTAKLFFKYSDKRNESIGSLVASALNRKGHNVPKIFVPSIETRLDNSISPANRGQIYERVDADSLENLLYEDIDPKINIDLIEESFPYLMRVFEDMKGIYLEKHENFSRKFNESLPDRTFLRSLVRTLKENGSSEFSKLLESTHLKIDDVDQDEELKNLESSVDHPSLDKSSISLVHGDLHQGNVLFQRDVYETDGEEQVIGVTSKGIIDWDSAGFDIPYQDFFHLSVISDLERDSTLYNEARDSFLEMQSESFPGVTEEKMKFTEFITYLSLLNRYYKAIKDKEIRPEFRKNVLKSCTYLFERSKETVRELSELTNDTELEQSYDAFSSDKFKKLDNVDSDPDASVAYAHTVNQKFRKTNKNEMALVNRKRHQENIEHLVGGEARSRSVLPIDIATLWGVYVVGVGFGLNEIPHDDPSYPQFIEEAKTYGKMLLGLSGVGTLMYYKENVRNFIREKKSKLFKKS